MEICRIQEMSSITKDIIVQQYNREKNIVRITNRFILRTTAPFEV